MLTSLEEHQLLVFWTQLFVLVAVARALGFLVRRIGLPSVIGELAAGLVLGPSIFGSLFPDQFAWFLPHDEVQSAALLAVGWIGVALLLVVTGFETDLALIRRLGRAAALVTASSLLLPLFGGLAIGFALPDTFVGDGASRTVFALFVAAALAVSSLAVIAKILGELGLMRRDFGQITVAAGMANDVVGWVMLAVFAGIATSGTVSFSGVSTTVGGLTAFVVVAFTVGQRGVDFTLREIRRRNAGLAAALTTTVILMLGFGVATQALGIEAVLGAFVAGVILNRSRFQDERVVGHIESLTMAFFAPVFFATAGLRVDLGLLDSSEAIGWAVAVIAVAIVAKFLGAFLGARLAGQSNRASIALGAGLNARGALEIVIATVGLSLGVFNDTAYTVIVIVPMVTSVFASFSLRLAVRDWRGSADEQERLDREEALARNVVVKSARVLLPSKGGPASIAAAQVAHFAWPPESAVTVVSVNAERREDVDVDPLRNVFYGREFEHKRIAADDPGSEIAAEAGLGYGVIVVGAAVAHDDQLLSPMVDDIIRQSPVPVVIVRRALNLDRPLPGAFSRALVPVGGGRSSRAAQEVAFSISDDLGTDLVLTHVINKHQPLPLLTIFGRMRADDPASEVADNLLSQASDRANEQGLTTSTEVRHGASTGAELVRAASEVEADLVVIGATIRSVDGRPYLGHSAETVLDQCDATVIVVATRGE